MVLCSPYNTPAVIAARDIIKNLVGKYNVMLDTEEFAGDSEVERVQRSMLAAHTFKKLRASSPFTKVFQRSLSDNELPSSTNEVTPNICHSAAGFNVITSMLFLFPLCNMSLWKDLPSNLQAKAFVIQRRKKLQMGPWNHTSDKLNTIC